MNIRNPHKATRFVDSNGKPYGIEKAGNFPIFAMQDFIREVFLDNVPGYFGMDKFGSNDSVGSTEEIIATQGGIYVDVATAEQFKVSSSSVNDFVSGTGLQTVKLIGLNSAYVEISEIVTMAGVIDVTTTLSFLRVNRAIGLTAGSGGTNDGLISIRDNLSVVNLLQIEAGKGQTLYSRWTVPNNCEGMIVGMSAGSSISKEIEISLYVRPFGEIFQIKGHEHMVDGRVDLVMFQPIKARSDIEMRAKAAGAGGSISSRFVVICKRL